MIDEQYLSEWNDVFDEIIQMSDKARGVDRATTKAQKSQRLRRLKERAGIERTAKPDEVARKLMTHLQAVYQAEEIHEYDRYGVPVGTDVVSDEDDDIPPKFHLGEPPSITFDSDAVGGGKRKNSRFNVWIREVLLPRRPDLRESLDSIEDEDKRNRAFKRLSFVMRKTIAERGLTPNAKGVYDNKDRLVGIKYNSGKVFKVSRRKW